MATVATTPIPHSFQQGAPAPVDAPLTLTNSSASLLGRLARMVPTPRILVSGADDQDIEATREAIKVAHDVFVSHIGRLLVNLNENLPVTETIEAASYMSGLAELHSDLDGELMQAADRCTEENGQFGVGA